MWLNCIHVVELHSRSLLHVPTTQPVGQLARSTKLGSRAVMVAFCAACCVMFKENLVGKIDYLCERTWSTVEAYKSKTLVETEVFWVVDQANLDEFEAWRTGVISGIKNSEV